MQRTWRYVFVLGGLVSGLAGGCASDDPDEARPRDRQDRLEDTDHWESRARFVPDAGAAAEPSPEAADPAAPRDPRSPTQIIADLGGVADATLRLTSPADAGKPVAEHQSRGSGTLSVRVNRVGAPELALSVSVAHFQSVLEIVDQLAADLPAEWRPLASRKGNAIVLHGVYAVEIENVPESLDLRVDVTPAE